MDLAKRPVTVLWNSRSGWDEGERDAEIVREVLSRGGNHVEFRKIQKGDDIVEQCRNCLGSGAEVFVAAGGDGTVNAVASAIVNTTAALGVIPSGTLNHFARDLEIPLKADEAAQELVNGHQVSVDVGSVNGRIFINNSVIGLYPIYRAAREALERKQLGRSRIGQFFAVLGGIARVFWRLPHLRLRLVLDGREREIRTPFVLIANNEHELESWQLGRRTSLSEGRLWVYVMRSCSRWKLLRFFVNFVFHQFRREDAFEVFKVSALSIRTKRDRIGVGVDGEIVKMQTPLEYKSLPRALHVIAPAKFLPEAMHRDEAEAV